jgi:hypothetical protein
MDFNLITISTSFLDELDPAEASERIGKTVTEPGIYRVVYECGAVDCDYLGDVDQIDIRDIRHDSKHFFFERENGVLVVNDSEDCAPAEYYRVG